MNRLKIGSYREGIMVDYYPTVKRLDIHGFYDGMVGIEGRKYHLGDFLRGLRITLKDCEKALKEERLNYG